MDAKSLLPSHWSIFHPAKSDAPHPFQALQAEMNRVFDNFTHGFPTFGTDRSDTGEIVLNPRIDVSESDDEIQVSVELPGVDEKGVDVTLADDVLYINGEKKAEKETKKKDYRLVERSYGMFQRAIPVPSGLNPDDVKASFKKGVLTVTLTKSPELKKRTRKIPVT